MSLVHHSPGPYTDYRYSQFANRDDLVMYSGLVKAMVRVPWPVGENGTRVTPDEMFDWLRDHDVYWPCFCSDTAYQSSSKFVVKPDGDVLAICKKYPSLCAFELNLTKIHKSTLIEGQFRHLVPSQTFWRKGEFKTKMAAFVEVFHYMHHYQADIMEEDVVQNPTIFWGYCGDSDVRIEQEGCEWREGMGVTWFDKYSRATAV
ncbi:hypothetical protein NMY22_g10383 [Coprinellus aureogranulatus]|nr:hypothetical protein NMY22_g10383 [Coprinellus aureogranulatus]